MQRADPAMEQPATRRPVAPRVADRSTARAAEPVRPPVVIAAEDNPLRGWRRILAIPLVDFAWRRGVETNAVACYLAGRRRGGVGEAIMAVLPIMVVLAAFAWAMTATPLRREEIWILTMILAFLLQPLTMILGALLMGWGLRRYLVGLSVEQLLSTRLKPEEILRGLTIRPVCCVSALALVGSLPIPLLVLAAVLRSGHPLDGEWVLLGFLALIIGFFGAALGGQLGAALAMRAHIYLRNSAMATMRAFIDMLALAGRLLLLALLVFWICGFFVVAVNIIAGNSAAGFFGFNRFGAARLLDSIMMMILFGAALVLVGAGVLYVCFVVIMHLRQALESAVEFTYLYPEEWWITNPGRGAEEDTYRPGVPWIDPHSETMYRFRSRACGK